MFKLGPKMGRRTCLGLLSFVLALLPISSVAQADIEGLYSAQGGVTAGMLVSLAKPSPATIEPTNLTNQGQMLGVAILPASPGNTKGEMAVATSGVVNVFVTDLGGAIHKGDAITASPLAGIGQVATADNRMAGLAQSNFDAKAPGAKQVSVAGAGGTHRNVAVGLIPVLVSVVGANPAQNSSASFVPRGVYNALANLAGHDVGTTQLILALAILGLAIISLMTLLYSAVRSSLISIGRNPLASHRILSGLAQVLALSAGILVIAGVLVYFVVRS